MPEGLSILFKPKLNLIFRLPRIHVKHAVGATWDLKMQGTLNEIDLSSILQLVELGQRTGELLI